MEGETTSKRTPQDQAPAAVRADDTPAAPAQRARWLLFGLPALLVLLVVLDGALVITMIGFSAGVDFILADPGRFVWQGAAQPLAVFVFLIRPNPLAVSRGFKAALIAFLVPGALVAASAGYTSSTSAWGTPEMWPLDVADERKAAELWRVTTTYWDRSGTALDGDNLPDCSAHDRARAESNAEKPETCYSVRPECLTTVRKEVEKALAEDKRAAALAAFSKPATDCYAKVLGESASQNQSFRSKYGAFLSAVGLVGALVLLTLTLTSSITDRAHRDARRQAFCLIVAVMLLASWGPLRYLSEYHHALGRPDIATYGPSGLFLGMLLVTALALLPAVLRAVKTEALKTAIVLGTPFAVLTTMVATSMFWSRWYANAAVEYRLFLWLLLGGTALLVGWQAWTTWLGSGNDAGSAAVDG